MKVDPAKSIHQNYNDLCVRFRELEKGRNAKAWVCTACRRPESEHTCSGHCTNYATSLAFRSEEQNEIEVVNKQLSLLDGLLEIVSAR